jgi:hypothetical protein
MNLDASQPTRAARPVLQDWAMRVPLMQQTVLMTAIRGPDGVAKYHPVKPILRWYRRCLLLSALDGEVISNPYDPRGGSFTGPSIDMPARTLPQTRSPFWELDMDLKVDEAFACMDEMALHFWLHLMHAVEIMGYKHDDARIAKWWQELYVRMVDAFHLYPESIGDLDKRLGDTRDGWLARADRAMQE